MRGRVATYSTAAATTSGSQAGPVARRSRSPTVSRPRRRLPAGVTVVDAGELEDEVGDAVGGLAGVVDAEAGGVAAVVLDAFEELGGELFSHAGELVEVAGFGGGFEGVDVGDLEGGPDEGDGFGAHAGEAEEFEHGGAVAGEEFGTQRHGAGGDEVADVEGHGLADAGDGEEGFGVGFGGGEGGQLGGLLLDGFGGAAVGADAEDVGTIDFEQGGGFVEEAGEGEVIHKRRAAREQNKEWPDGWPLTQYAMEFSYDVPRYCNSQTSEVQCYGSGQATASFKRVTWSACGPLLPWMMSNSTLSPSFRVL